MEIKTKTKVDLVIRLTQEEAERAVLDPRDLVDAIQDRLPPPDGDEPEAAWTKSCPSGRRGRTKKSAAAGTVDCPQCGKKYKNTHGLNIHMAQKHPEGATS